MIIISHELTNLENYYCPLYVTHKRYMVRVIHEMYEVL